MHPISTPTICKNTQNSKLIKCSMLYLFLTPSNGHIYKINNSFPYKCTLYIHSGRHSPPIRIEHPRLANMFCQLCVLARQKHTGTEKASKHSWYLRAASRANVRWIFQSLLHSLLGQHAQNSLFRYQRHCVVIPLDSHLAHRANTLAALFCYTTTISAAAVFAGSRNVVNGGGSFHPFRFVISVACQPLILIHLDFEAAIYTVHLWTHTPAPSIGCNNFRVE